RAASRLVGTPGFFVLRRSPGPMVTRLVLATFFSILISALSFPPAEDRTERFRRMSLDAETKGLAEAFHGITTNGVVIPGLFTIRSTGVSTEPVRKAAETFLAALTKEQRDKTMFSVDDPEWRKWMNQHFYIRQGVSFLEMSGAQREAAFELFRASLS